MLTKKYFKVVYCLAVLFFLIWFIKLLAIFPWNMSKYEISDQLDLTELIVVLSGEYYERIEHAYDLAIRGYSNQIFIPNIGYPESRQFAIKKMHDTGIPFIEGTGAD